ncbi:AraC family transcriptional regulator [Hahella sp. CCB-MM4]|uniref:AraC family transcriptional regulator n=1 Tax=Hahella sp. (strain CCB-MM4) TaxID=1926491 RepID=UPI000B9B808C|nr:helix-turn-helix transcriptional regulator [Hahella sp. CCB-MM4]OZG70159.1 AraC family transcriptional regulator [Hahella sp. CCB-MM4]
MTIPLINPALVDSSNGAVIVAVMEKGPISRTTVLHNHHRGQLFGAIKGLISVDTERGKWVVPATHSVWIPPGSLHAFCSHGPFHGWSLYIAEEACHSLPHQPCTFTTTGLLREAIHRSIHWNHEALNEPQMRIARVILDEIQSMPMENLGLPLPESKRLLRVTDALLSDLSITLSLTELADISGYPTRTLSRRFKQETDFSLGEWRQRARVIRALELLADGVPVTSVALSLGYNNVSAFISVFKEHFGVTPGRYFDTLQS